MNTFPVRPRVASIGCGYWGKNLVRNLSDLGSLAAVCDANVDRARAYSEKYEVPCLSFDAILAASDIDAVVIATPAESHSTMTNAALRAGKDVFVEKPLALTCRDAEASVEAAQQASRTLMVGHLLQYHPGFVKLRDLVRNGQLGRLRYLYSHRLNLGKFRRSEDVFWSFAPHDISMILGLTGEEPDAILATGASYLHKSLADVTTTHLSFPSGIHGHIFVSWLHPFKEQKLVAVGEDGMAVFDDTRSWSEKLLIFPHRVEWRDGIPQPRPGDARPVELLEDEPLRCEMEHFLACVSNGIQPRTDGTEGLRVLRVLEAAASSAAARSSSSSSASSSANPPDENSQDVFVHPSAYVDDGCQIGRKTKIWHFSHVLSGTTIGTHCVLGQNVMLGPNVTVGDRCKIQNNVSVYQGVHLDDGVFCGPSCVFTNVVNPRAEIERKDEFKRTFVGKGATIGANATIICGTEIGEYAFVAAGAVVTRSVPAYALVAGVPARRIGWMSPAGERLGTDLVCPRTGRRFEVAASGELKEITI